MIKKKNIIFIFLIIIFFIFGVYLISQNENNKFSKKIKDNIPTFVKDILKDTIFYVAYTKREIKNLNSTIKKLSEDNNILMLENYKLNNILNYGKFKTENYKLKNFKFNSVVLPFYDIENIYANKKSGYLELYKNKIIIVFTSGKIIYIDKASLFENNLLKFNKIDNNVQNNFFDQKINWSGIKDIKVINDDLYISLTKEVKVNCYNTSLYKAKINEIKLNFTKVFEPIECFDLGRSIKAFRYFNGYQNGGRITNNDKKIFLTFGDYNYWEKTQDKNSYAGKILSVDILNNKIEVVSMGHRNPQGLQIIENKNLLISTEHGPKGGDEINLIKLTSNEIPSYGWPISSYGEHYDVVPINSFTKKFAPLHKSHRDYGFIEPIKYFKKSIGISEIIKDYNSNTDNIFYVTSLKQETLYKAVFDKEFSFVKFENEILISERLRDIIYDTENNCYYIYAENTPKLIQMCQE